MKLTETVIQSTMAFTGKEVGGTRLVFSKEEISKFCILASVSFWPLLIIESVACFSRMTCLLNGYNVKGESDCFNCKTGGGGGSQIVHFNVYKRKELQSTFLRKKSARLWGIFNNYKENLSVPEVNTAALTES